MIFTIGQVAKMYNISHDTLRYYDKIDLLKPSLKKDNGYRYYTIREIELLEIILVAKQLEIPIKDIKDIIKKEDESSYIELFKNHKKLLEEKIEYLTKLKDEVQHSIDVTTQMKNFSNKEKEKFENVYIEKDIIYFNQNDYNHFGKFLNKKNLILKIDNINNENILFNENIIGFELDNEVISNDAKYEKIKYKGNYILLTRKDTASNIEKFIEECIKEIYKDKNIEKNINVFIECLFTLLKKSKKNIYFVKIYIENIR
ncbi:MULTISPECIES: MerR family transcriptional regulator [Romboutsia]|uniref:Helix_turn_helix, mercury resistance n=1 Tax=Romboutsia hominis TaxID=1507512 RepID=A0A2P2BT48_9FIRM|nr:MULTISPECIES: MerR family transcriptional regulator [Romboutsia]MCH1960823.1 MerR family transcriptional regulator [Romboutsia hominis]MDB8793743.1 MerR family transcriptional regulator [Romboutsia sp. 1001216sp1]MDB8795140.1 MerR family transcriptional regulator [Romboutsia sp. 1001216sp1]MDB8798950.1 MerR family transcriptional regulator [Romboutsia sp. 1001216sp1]CEI73557.1 helix_turn_helix, mercury resistance [Romboutsia hominis]